ncbi:hypothetical protein Tco_0443043 [Tanacetum coccineum]
MGIKVGPQDEAIYEEWDDRVERATTTAASLDAEQASGNINRTQSTTIPNVPLPQGIGAGGSPRCQEAMRVPLLRLVESLEADLKQTKQVYGAAYTKLIIKGEDQPKDQLGVLSTAKVLADAAKTNVHTYTRRRRAVSTGSGGISTAEESVSTAGASMPVSTAGKGKMEESKDEQTKRTKLQQEQERLGHEAVVRLQEELDEEERKRMAIVHEAAQSFTKEEWENIRARVEADEELSKRL